jgi:hypothetical protein
MFWNQWFFIMVAQYCWAVRCTVLVSHANDGDHGEAMWLESVEETQFWLYMFRVSHFWFILSEAPSCLVRDVMEIYKNKEYKNKSSKDTEGSVEISRAIGGWSWNLFPSGGVQPAARCHIFILSVHRVIQEESAVLWKMIVCVILSKKVHMNMGPILNGYRDNITTTSHAS